MRDVYILSSLFPVLANARSHWTENMAAVTLLQGCPSVKSTAAVLSKHLWVSLCTHPCGDHEIQQQISQNTESWWWQKALGYTVSTIYMWQNSTDRMNLRSCKGHVLLFTHWKWKLFHSLIEHTFLLVRSLKFTFLAVPFQWKCKYCSCFISF